MNCRLCKTLGFSEPFLSADYMEDISDLFLNNRTILLNAADTEITIEGKPLKPWNSSIYSSVAIQSAQRIICITIDADFLSSGLFPQREQIMSTWTHVYDVFRLAHLKDTQLWRSDKERIGNIEFNLWYAVGMTNCGIHAEHAFRELHTQVFGIGRMQKFRENNYATIYEDIFMSPGHTHQPFYDENGLYPWHQYWSDTDCIWLATELYDE